MPSNSPRMGKILCVQNEKGGAGKTNTACNLAGSLGLRNFDVLVADLDPQQTSANWLARADGANFKGTIWPGFRYREKITAELEKLCAKYDIIVVDCPPSVENPATWAVLLVADMVLIPTKLGPADIDAVPAAKNLVKKAQEKTGRDYPVRVLPVATRLHMADDKAAIQSLSRDKQYPCLPITLGDRKAFTRAMLIGATAHSIRNGEEAVRELEALTDATLKLLGLPSKHR